MAMLEPAAVKSHFSKFGDIKDVQIIYDKTSNASAQCIIKFQKAEGASAALKLRHHTINHKLVTVEACSSWKPPFEIENSPTDNNINLLSIDDYCLESIFQNLVLQDQISLSLCHPLLGQIFMDMIFRRLNRNIKFGSLRNFSTGELRQLFRIVRIYLERIENGKQSVSYSSWLSIFDLMRECCLQIKRLHIIYPDPGKDKVLRNPLQLDHITELELCRCRLHDSDLIHLRRLDNLYVLGLAENVRIKGNNLKYLRKLRQLSLYGCISITMETVDECCQHLELSYLDTRYTNVVQYPGRSIVHCPTVSKVLKVPAEKDDNDGDTINIAKIPMLKSLQDYFFHSACKSIFCDALVEYYADDLVKLKFTGQYFILSPLGAANIEHLRKLRKLYISGYKYGVSRELLKLFPYLSDLDEISLIYTDRIKNKHLLPLLTNCAKLKRIDLRMCQSTTTKFVWDALEILQKREMETTAIQQTAGMASEKPAIMLVYGTRINEDILQCILYKENQHLLIVLYHGDISFRGLVNECSVFSPRDTYFKYPLVEEIDEDNVKEEDSSDEG